MEKELWMLDEGSFAKNSVEERNSGGRLCFSQKLSSSLKATKLHVVLSPLFTIFLVLFFKNVE